MRLACSRFKQKTTCIANTSSSLLPSHTPNHYQSAKCIDIPVVKPTVTRETTKRDYYLNVHEEGLLSLSRGKMVNYPYALPEGVSEPGSEIGNLNP